jgi:hypothetical protein
MKLIKATTWTAAFAAGLFLGSVAHGNAHASPILQSSSQQAPNPNQTDRDRGSQDRQGDRDRGSKAEPASVTGELSNVNPQAMTFSVKSASGAEMLFRYDDRTIVAGAESNVAGLATSSGAEVTVTYRNDNAGNMASKIEVHAKR